MELRDAPPDWGHRPRAPLIPDPANEELLVSHGVNGVNGVDVTVDSVDPV
jgi:hypothetical protein